MFDRPALLIANDRSRRGNEVAPFIRALEAAGLAVRREQCQSGDDLAGLIRAARNEVGSVILGGGDGTMHRAAPALIDTGLPLGILPLGTANDLARSLDIPNNAEGAAATIVSGRTRAIDLGTVNGIPFFNVASLGLSVGVTRRLTGLVKRRFGPLAYPLVAAVTVMNTRRFRASLRVDGGEAIRTKSLQIAVGNGLFYGGGAKVDTAAQIDDGLLNVYSLEPRARWRLLFLARAFRAGEHERLREVRNLVCTSLTITTKRPRHIAADGEIISRTPAQFGILPRAIRVFAP